MLKMLLPFATAVLLIGGMSGRVEASPFISVGEGGGHELERRDQRRESPSG